MHLDSSSRTVRQVLGGNFFTIPRYQRPYSWTKEEIDEFWEDAVTERIDAYFIGSMVVYPGKSTALAVIDGQQRLTTIAMMLAAIRDAADARGMAKLAGGTHTFLERRDENDEDHPVLRARSSSSYAYLHEVFSRDRTKLTSRSGGEESTIRTAFQHICSLLEAKISGIESGSSLSSAQVARKVQNMLLKIREQILGLQFIFVEVTTVDDATAIFVTLNARGRDLEPSDLVKAHLMQVLPKKGALDKPLTRWNAIVDKFDSSEASISMTEFLLASYRSRYGVATKKSLSKEVRKIIKSDRAVAEQYFVELVDDAELFRQLKEPGYRKWEPHEVDIRRSVQFFCDFNISQPIPMLLSLLRAYIQREISPKQTRAMFVTIENYYFAFNALAKKSSSGGVSATFHRRARELLIARSTNERVKLLRDLRDYLQSRRPSDQEFDEAFGRLWLTDDNTADKKIVRYILRRFYLHENPSSAIDFSLSTVEHLASQSHGSDVRGRIGNLILVSQGLNQSLASKDFAEKKAILRSTKGEWIPKEILSARTWGADQIASRTKAMAKLARTKVWAT